MRKLAVLFALALLPLAAARAQSFCPGVAPWVFADVQASDSFCTYITWMAVTGVTTGCQVIDANNRLYCPDDLVTRKQMSAFMSRLGRDVTFAEGGNAFGTLPNNTAVLGTADGNALDVRVNDSRVMRYEPNAISPNVIGGSPANNVTAGVRGATIAGGGVPTGADPNFFNEAPNRVTDAYGTVGGGYGNRAGDDDGSTTDSPFATVGGGNDNTASSEASTVGGGQLNTASGSSGTVGGGLRNTASGPGSTVSGGFSNVAINHSNNVSGGWQNIASGTFSSTVGGGRVNLASGSYSTVGGGGGNTASGNDSTVGGGVGNTASGNDSTVGGGASNTASGVYSWAGGRRAKTQTADASPIPHDGAFVWADSSDLDFHSTANDQFSARATGGVRFVTAINGTGTPTAGVSLAPGDSAWAVLSDRAAKENWVDVDGHQVLDRLVAMPIGWWNYKAQSADVRHIGPTAQDFRAAFGLGRGDTTIATIDADGVALAAIQGLNAKVEARLAEKDAAIAARDAEIAELKAGLAELRRAVALLNARVGGDERVAAR